MEHALQGASALSNPDFEKLVVRVRIIATHVDRDRHLAFPGEGDLLCEDRALDLAWRVHVVVVESALTKRDDAFVAEPRPDGGSILVVEFRGLVGMDSDGREDTRVALGQRDGRGIAGDSVARSDRDERVDAPLEASREDFGSIRIEFTRSDVTMAIEPHVVRFSLRRGFYSPQDWRRVGGDRAG